MRRGIANWLRQRSSEATSGKPEAIMDVAPEAVESAFRNADVTRMIHGHTHRPARHHLVVDGRECERFVLADLPPQPATFAENRRRNLGLD